MLKNNFKWYHGSPGYAGRGKAQLLAALIVLIASVEGASAGCACGGGGGNWEATAISFLNADVPVEASSAQSGAPAASKPEYRTDLFVKGEMLKPLPSVSSSDVVLDVGSGYGSNHIKGAINLPFSRLLDDSGMLRPDAELSRIFGDAGIAADDNLVVYGDKVSEATFVLWALQYLGIKNVKLLDGGLSEWTAARLPVEKTPSGRPAVNFTSNPRGSLLASYNDVKDGTAQIVDARPFTEFAYPIPNSTKIYADRVLDGGRIKAPAELNETFSRLGRDRPVVVYSRGGVDASLVWYALQLMGYDSRLYTWEDLIAHQSGPKNGEAILAGNKNLTPGRYKRLGIT
jgi:thiosulfate/3-mercaptopyruvate sulfurtransferase